MTVRLRPRRILLALLAVLLAAGLVDAPPAGAEVLNPRQQWMRESTAGLFLHWGMFTSPAHLDCAQWEHDVTAGGWTPGYWIDEALKLGASYVVLTTFHSRLGYARPWPSKIRSEERRVGKECRSRWWRYHYKDTDESHAMR